MLPSNANNPNPFFSNIRQNMDLADGVGQMDITVPSNLDSNTLPPWLQDITRSSDHGKKASERFLNIERSEQSRMKEAYASFNASAPPSQNSGRICLSGVEQGVKNRYKDILPFEHARVRLAGRAQGACDYINASHVQASRSHKRYIASQGPLPATFDVSLPIVIFYLLISEAHSCFFLGFLVCDLGPRCSCYRHVDCRIRRGST